MMIKKNSDEVLENIKNIYPKFEKENFINGVEAEITNLYYNLCKSENKDYINIEYDSNLINKLINNPETYRINKNFDNISIQYIDLSNFVIDNNNKIIQLYLSVFFFDDTKNNENYIGQSNKYWNDIWCVSYINNEAEILKCKNCGATMAKNEHENILTCPYCRNSKYYDFRLANWKIYDIEVIK